MAMTSVQLSRSVTGDGNIKEIYSCFSDAATGTITLPGGNDFRNLSIIATDSSTAGTVIGKNYDISTGIVTLTGMTATTALTGVSGGTLGGVTFTGTGGVIGRYVSGDANFQANTMITNVSGTTISVDKTLLGAIAAANINTHATLEVTYAV